MPEFDFGENTQSSEPSVRPGGQLKYPMDLESIEAAKYGLEGYLLPSSPGDTTKVLVGSNPVSFGSFPTIRDTDVVFSDTIGGNASTSNHGFLAKLNGDSTTFLNPKRYFK